MQLCLVLFLFLSNRFVKLDRAGDCVYYFITFKYVLAYTPNDNVLKMGCNVEGLQVSFKF